MEFICFIFVVLSLFSLGTDKQHSVERTVFNPFSDACLTAARLEFGAKRTQCPANHVCFYKKTRKEKHQGRLSGETEASFLKRMC